MRLQDKARQVGFEWENREQVWDKVEEETAELMETVEANDKDRMEAEFGDLMFALVNYSRFLGIDAENALERTNKKFIRRFRKMEEMAAGQAASSPIWTLRKWTASGIKSRKANNRYAGYQGNTAILPPERLPAHHCGMAVHLRVPVQ